MDIKFTNKNFIMTRVKGSKTDNYQLIKGFYTNLKDIKKLKKDKITDPNIIEINNDDISKSIWNINSILKHIFSYIEYSELVKFNTVCKKWYHLTNPIIHNSIRLVRCSSILNKVHNKKFKRSAKMSADVELCIANNSKYCAFVQDLRYDIKLSPPLAISFFQTFRFISNLSLLSVEMSQDQFLGMVAPLTQLKKLTLNYICIKYITKKRLFTKKLQLPSTLTNLSIEFIEFIGYPELFVQTINSHTSLEKFRYTNYTQHLFLEPFMNFYPSLKRFEYNQMLNEHPSLLSKIYTNNPQLTPLKLN
jgi:hypothetical protein